MSALNIGTQIPNSINSLERLAAWTGLALYRCNPNRAVLESDVRSEFVAQTGIFTAADETNRLLIRLSLELDPEFMSDASKKLWMHVKEFPGSPVIPAAFTNS